MTRHSDEPTPVHARIAILIILRVIIALVAIIAAPANLKPTWLHSDALRYEQIAEAPGRAYRDHEVEYPPVLAVVIEAIGHAPGDGSGGLARRVAVLGLVLDLGTAGVLGAAFGRRVAERYLLLGTPIVGVGLAYARLDLVPVFFAALGLAFMRRQRYAAAGAAWVLGAFAKLWPAALLPALIVARRWRAAAISAALAAAGGAWWITYAGGTAGLRQVLTMRGARGWQVESLPGSLWMLVTSATPRFEAGAWRVGDAPGWIKGALVVASVASIALMWRRAAAARDSDNIRTALSAVRILLLAAPLLSTQFLLWLLPMAAIVSDSDQRLRRMMLASTTVTAVLFIAMDRVLAGQVLFELLAVARNALLVALLVACVRKRLPTFGIVERLVSDSSSTTGVASSGT